MRRTYYKLLGLLLFLFVVMKVNWGHIFMLMKDAKIPFLGVSLALILIICAIRALRWWFLMRIQNIKYSVKDSLLMHLVGILAAQVTPGRLGEFAVINYLRKDGYSFGPSFMSVLTYRFLDLVFISMVGFLSVLLLPGLAEMNLIKGALLGSGCISLLFGAVLLKARRSQGSLGNIISGLAPRRFRERIVEDASSFSLALGQLNRPRFLALGAITLLLWYLTFLMCYTLAHAIGINISFFQQVAVSSILSVVIQLPISVAGVGTRDFTLIYLFPLLHFTQEQAVAYSLLILSFLYVTTCLMGLLAWFLKPIPLFTKE